MRWYICFVVVVLSSALLFADEEITANPNRPTVSNPADITQYGVLEAEYGVEAGGGSWQLSGLLKYSAAHDLELRLDHVPIQHQGDDSSFGDTGVGFQYRFVHQDGGVPSMAVAYSLGLPTARGATRYSHQLVYLISRDAGAYHVDFNAAFAFPGREGAGGFDKVFAPALAVSHGFGNLTLAAEISGASRQNDETPSSVSNLWAASYNLSSRCVVDAAVSFGLKDSDNAFLAGITYSIAELHHH